MLFNSYTFIFFFLPVAFLGYFLLNYNKKVEGAKVWLVASSLFFYSWWNVIYLPLILLSVLLNYKLSRVLIEDEEGSLFTKKQYFVVGLVLNISLLVYFKYMDFFITNVNFISGENFELWHLALPLAISFFTLQQIAFLVDSYEGLVKEKNFLDYSLFVTFFPQLIAGPIVHHQEMMPQFSRLKNKLFNYKNIAAGVFIFSIGLFKKVVIADSFSKWVHHGFDHSQTLTLIEGWVTSLAYTFQIYFDFSGYTDMAIGAALLFNIKLPQNFNSPYKATGIIDYWQRWHMTLTIFITTYVYTPILRSFSKITFFKAMFATFAAMFISGLWHGAGWTFIVWGSLHGFALMINHYWHKSKRKMSIFLAWFITFNFVNITGIFFRAENLSQAKDILQAMFTGNIMLPIQLESRLVQLKTYGVTFGSLMGTSRDFALATILIVISFFISLVLKNSNEKIEDFKPSFLVLLLIVPMFIYSIYNMQDVSEFLYFNF